jgi:hypothetical protein
VRHARLEDGERGQVRLRGGVVLGERAAAALDLAGALARQEAKMAVARVLELGVRHLVFDEVFLEKERVKKSGVVFVSCFKSKNMMNSNGSLVRFFFVVVGD